MVTTLESAEFEFSHEYLEEAWEKFQEGAQVISADDVRITKGKGYTSWFEHASDDKKYPTARFNSLGKILFKTTFMLD